MKELMIQYLVEAYTKEEMTAIGDAFKVLIALLHTPPVMTDDDFNALSKMAKVKRKEVGENADAFEGSDSFLTGSAASSKTKSNLLSFDQALQIEIWTNDLDKKNWRAGDVAGAMAMNRVSYAESFAKMLKGAQNEEAIEVCNKLDRLKNQRKLEKGKPVAAAPKEAKQ